MCRVLYNTSEKAPNRAGLSPLISVRFAKWNVIAVLKNGITVDNAQEFNDPSDIY